MPGLTRYFNGKTVSASSKAQKIASHMSTVFNQAHDHRLSCQPAAQFADHAHLRGIAGRYVFSKGVTPNEIENVLIQIGQKSDVMPLYRKLWAHLKSMNPELKKIRLRKDNVENIRDAIMGVSSGFNIDDIVYFLKLRRQNILAALYNRTQPNTFSMISEIEERSGATMYWVASPQTLTKIRDRLRRRGK